MQSLLSIVFRRPATTPVSTPVSKPVELDARACSQVSGGSPNGRWSASMTVTASPNSTW